MKDFVLEQFRGELKNCPDLDVAEKLLEGQLKVIQAYKKDPEQYFQRIQDLVEDLCADDSLDIVYIPVVELGKVLQMSEEDYQSYLKKVANPGE